MPPISGLVYRWIMSSERELIARHLARRRADHGRGQRAVREEIARDAGHVLGGDALDARERLVEPEVTLEVNLLPRQVRHPAGGVLEAQHQAALEMILGAAQLRVRHRRLLQAAQLLDAEV